MDDFATLAMQWAHSDKTQVREQTVRFRGNNAVLIEKTADGYIEIKTISDTHSNSISNVYREVKTNNARLHEVIYKDFDGYETTRRDGVLYSRTDVGKTGIHRQDGGVYQEQYQRIGNGVAEKGNGNSGIKYSLRDNATDSEGRKLSKNNSNFSKIAKLLMIMAIFWSCITERARILTRSKTTGIILPTIFVNEPFYYDVKI